MRVFSALMVQLMWHLPLSLCGQGTVRFISFNGQPSGTAVVVHSYLEAGMQFTGADTNWNTFTRRGSGSYGWPDNGTAYVQGAFTDSLKFFSVDGSPFNAEFVDLAEYSDVVSDPRTFYFIGYRHDGSVVTNSFTTDGIFDGTGPLPDFQTFQFSSEMRNLDRVEIPLWSYGWSLDNLVVSIPEPNVGALALAGALALLLHRGSCDKDPFLESLTNCRKSSTISAFWHTWP